MKKMISFMVAVGMIAALSIPAFAAEAHGTPNSNAPAEPKPAVAEISGGLDPFAEEHVTTIGEGLDPMATMEDEAFNNEAPNHSGVLLVEDGGEYLSTIGEGLSDTDMAKDPIDRLVPPAQP